MPQRLDTLRSPGQADVTIPQSGDRGCLSNDELLAFAQGNLSSEQLEAIHGHLDHCATCQKLLSEAMRSLATEPTPEGDDLEWNTMFLPNAMVANRYRIQRFIARGGMGEVYEGFDCDLNERVALKTVASTTCDSPRAVRHLKAEVQMARRVSHHNVCRIFDLGTHALERTGALIHFLTMEFVDGVPLGQRLRSQGALPLEQAQALARQLLEGLSAAHRAGILHRDFKSDNVMLRTETNGELTPLILDFGLARSLKTDARHLTSGQNQALVGTLSYMAPEQIEGKPLSAASDIYAFGVVWFEMLTGQLPFQAETAAANALERLHKTPAVPSSINREIPPALDEIVLTCLGRFPEDRFQSAEDVLAALDALPERRSRTVTASRRDSTAAEPRRWLRAVLATGLVGAVGAAAWWATHARSPIPPDNPAPVISGMILAPSAAPAPSPLASSEGREPSTEVPTAPRQHRVTTPRPMASRTPPSPPLAASAATSATPEAPREPRPIAESAKAVFMPPAPRRDWEPFPDLPDAGPHR